MTGNLSMNAKLCLEAIKRAANGVDFVTVANPAVRELLIAGLVEQVGTQTRTMTCSGAVVGSVNVRLPKKAAA